MAKKKSAKPKPKAAAKKGPRQTSLLGMADRKIAALQEAALSYAECRDQRIALLDQESELKQELLDLMHKHKKTHYVYGNVAIDIVPEGEKLKVKIKSADEVEEPSHEESAPTSDEVGFSEPPEPEEDEPEPEEFEEEEDSEEEDMGVEEVQASGA